MYTRNNLVLDAQKGEAAARFGEHYRRMLLISSEAFIRMMSTLYAFGPAGLTIFYMMGKEKGRYDALKETETLRQQQTPFTKRKVLENVVHQVRITGWGAPRIQKYNEKQGALKILVENNPLVDAFRPAGEPDRPSCHYFRGYWAGAVSAILERKASCTETKCVGIGDAYCEFKIQTKENGAELFEEVETRR